MIERKAYIKQLYQYLDKPLIKVLTGVRRSGKSTILQMFRDDLIRNNHIKAENAISINFEDMTNRKLLTADALYEHLLPYTQSNENIYIFLDEIQNVAEFERVLDSLFVQPNIDLYVTGSNARFLSSDLATMLTGRYIEIKVYPLSFAEYTNSFEIQPDLIQAYNYYVTYSSFPEAVNLFKVDPQTVSVYLQSIYNTVVFRDVVARYGIRDDTKFFDVAKYLFDNIGNITDPKRISDYLTSNGRSTSNHTVESYISALNESFVVYSASRYDIKGKQLLKTNSKYYLVDPALRNLLSDASPSDYGRVLENVVFFELLRRYDKVWVGKTQNKEVDFVVRRSFGEPQIEYFQVALSVRDEATRTRELSALRTTDDYPKTLLTLDIEEGNYSGIIQRNVLTWLLDDYA